MLDSHYHIQNWQYTMSLVPGGEHAAGTKSEVLFSPMRNTATLRSHKLVLRSSRKEQGLTLVGRRAEQFAKRGDVWGPASWPRSDKNIPVDLSLHTVRRASVWAARAHTAELSSVAANSSKKCVFHLGSQPLPILGNSSPIFHA